MKLYIQHETWRAFSRFSGSCRPVRQRKIHGVHWILLSLVLMIVLAGCGGGSSSENTTSESPQSNQAPSFTSEDEISVPENTITVTTVSAGDADGDSIAYSISDENANDAELFHIDSNTGDLNFHKAADFENPGDSNTNNTYIVTVAASDGTDTTKHTLTISVVDVDDQLSVSVSPGKVNTLTFSWPDIEEATHYQLNVNPDGNSGYTQVGEDIAATHIDIAIPVHLTDWVNSLYMLEAYDGDKLVFSTDETAITDLMLESIGYIKASNAGVNDWFGSGTIALSADGNTLVVGARHEGSAATEVDGDQDDDTAPEAGAVYVFGRVDGVWAQQAYIKASNTQAEDLFGVRVALSADGNTLAVGAIWEDSEATGVDGDQDDNTASDAGAVYVFGRADGVWAQQAYLKASNAQAGDWFGVSVALSANGNTLAVGAINENSGVAENFTASRAGAVYVFSRVDGVWEDQAYIKASHPEAHDLFGFSIALSANGNTLAVGAIGEDSGVAGDEQDDTELNAGAVYVFGRMDSEWTQQAHIKAANVAPEVQFGYRVALSADGNMLAVGAVGEDNTATDSGAVYMLSRVDGEWIQLAYLKASNAQAGNRFGEGVALSADGNMLAVGARGEDSKAKGVDGDQQDDMVLGAGAVYVFSRMDGVWEQQAYIKASNTQAEDGFGESITLSADGKTLAVGASREDSAATGVDGDQRDNDAESAGAVYIY